MLMVKFTHPSATVASVEPLGNQGERLGVGGMPRASNGMLSDQEVREMRAARSRGAAVREIAKMYQRSVDMTGRILRGDAYGWVGEVDVSDEAVAASYARLQAMLAAPEVPEALGRVGVDPEVERTAKELLGL